MANERSKTIGACPYHEADVDLESTAAEATSVAETVLLPNYFRPGRPILAGLKVGQTAMNANAVLLEWDFTYDKVTDRITASIRFANNNVAAGAAIDPGIKRFWFVQL